MACEAAPRSCNIHGWFWCQQHQAGSGVSSTKLVWLSNGMLSCYCATIATVGGVGVYVSLQRADGVYWTAVGALWVNALGFATSAKKHQNQTLKELTIASQQTEKQGTENQGGTL